MKISLIALTAFTFGPHDHATWSNTYHEARHKGNHIYPLRAGVGEEISGKTDISFYVELK
jgi:hypothetical protein